MKGPVGRTCSGTGYDVGAAVPMAVDAFDFEFVAELGRARPARWAYVHKMDSRPTGLGWAGQLAAPLSWAVSSHAFHKKTQIKANENAARSTSHTISIYPVLESLGFRV